MNLFPWKPNRIPILIRWSNWGDSKMAFFFMIYGCLCLETNTPPALPSLLFLSAVYLLLASFGYLVNDLFDWPTDPAARERWGNTGWLAGPGAACIAAGLAAGTALFLFRASLVVWILAAAQAVLALFYVAPPLRLKERGPLGLAASALAQYLLPVLLLLSLFPKAAVLALIASLLSLVMGMRLIAIHQRIDARRDRAARVRTLGVQIGRVKMLAILKALIAAEILCGLSLAGYLGSLAPILWIVTAGFLLMIAWMWFKVPASHEQIFNLDSYHAYHYAHLNLWYCAVLPLCLLCILAARSPVLFLLLPLDLYWKRRNWRRAYQSLSLKKHAG